MNIPRTKSRQNPRLQIVTKTVKKVSALIIDDEADICYLLKEILRARKIQADSVNSLLEAENFLQKYDPNLIFLDNRLADGFGVDHVHDFKLKHPDTRIIMMSAYDNASDREKAYMEGADYFISKPFSRDDILKTVDSPV